MGASSRSRFPAWRRHPSPDGPRSAAGRTAARGSPATGQPGPRRLLRSAPSPRCAAALNRRRRSSADGRRGPRFGVLVANTTPTRLARDAKPPRSTVRSPMRQRRSTIPTPGGERDRAAAPRRALSGLTVVLACHDDAGRLPDAVRDATRPRRAAPSYTRSWSSTTAAATTAPRSPGPSRPATRACASSCARAPRATARRCARASPRRRCPGCC